ncbi:MAG: HNH endonuclease [Bdellovibrionales bacterium]|nr:HNH endonuclease [Bdellovibrionales bacterium]
MKSPLAHGKTQFKKSWFFDFLNVGVLVGRQIWISLVIALFVQPTFAVFPYTPNDPNAGSLCTPQDPHFHQYRYQEQIPYCERKVKESLKTKIFAAYGVPSHCRQEYTIDHYIPLALGGTNHINNLWPEHKAVKAVRQNLEVELYNALKDGRIRQAEALKIIVEAKQNPPIQKINLKNMCK